MRYYSSYNSKVEEFMPENMSHPDSDEEDSGRGGWWVVGQVLLFALFIGSLFAGGPPDDVPGIIFVQVVGVIVALIGVGVSIWAFRYHGPGLTPFPKPTDGMELIDEGPYRYVRHPMYSGIIAFTLGVGLAYANPVTLLSSFAFTVFFMAKSGYEEDMLVKELPGYRQYRSSVPWRLIPFVM
jgi:protein-S-isoprenylcysteine O-methyltransferase Ste14